MDHPVHQMPHQPRSCTCRESREHRVRHSGQVRRAKTRYSWLKMTARLRSRIVGVIASHADLDRAMRMRKPPDLFELRLDCLARIADQLEHKVSRLRAPLIITARHPQEGGANKLSLRQRRDLLTRFLHYEVYVY